MTRRQGIGAAARYPRHWRMAGGVSHQHLCQGCRGYLASGGDPVGEPEPGADGVGEPATRGASGATGSAARVGTDERARARTIARDSGVRRVTGASEEVRNRDLWTEIKRLEDQCKGRARSAPGLRPHERGRLALLGLPITRFGAGELCGIVSGERIEGAGHAGSLGLFVPAGCGERCCSRCRQQRRHQADDPAKHQHAPRRSRSKAPAG